MGSMNAAAIGEADLFGDTLESLIEKQPSPKVAEKKDPEELENLGAGTGHSVFCEKRLYQVVAHNARRAREVNGFSRKTAQQRLFRYSNPNMHANRISEVEGGNKRIDLKLLYRMCIEYNVTSDFLLGLSDEFERNEAAAYNGLIMNSVRGTVMEMTERVCMKMSGLMRHLPPFQGEALRSTAKDLLAVIDRLKLDMVFRSHYGELIDAAEEMRESVQNFDRYVARQMRIMESNMMDQIDAIDEKETHRSMVSFDEPLISEKL